MEPAVYLGLFIFGFLLGVTACSVYVSFGPLAKELRDPFAEHED
jgi:PsbN protein